MLDAEFGWFAEESEVEPEEESDVRLLESIAWARLAEARLWASISALMLSDEIWALLKPAMVGEFDDGASELSDASGRAGPKPIGGDDAGCGEVSDWMASRAAEAAPIAGSMAELRWAQFGCRPHIDEQAPCHGKKPNEIIVFGAAKSHGGAAIGAAGGSFFRFPEARIAQSFRAC